MAERAILIESLLLDDLPLRYGHAILLGGTPGRQWHVDLFGIDDSVLELLEGTHLISLEDEHGRRLAGKMRLKPGASRFFAYLEGCGLPKPAAGESFANSPTSANRAPQGGRRCPS